jgi:hypothetical protein
MRQILSRFFEYTYSNPDHFLIICFHPVIKEILKIDLVNLFSNKVTEIIIFG